MYINGHNNKVDVIQNVIENIDDGLLSNAKDMLNQLKEFTLGESFTFKNSQKDIEEVFYKGKEIGNVMHVNLGGKMFWSADILGKAKKMGHVSKTDAAKELLKSKTEQQVGK